MHLENIIMEKDNYLLFNILIDFTYLDNEEMPSG
jgi:hypothetical protein